MIQRQCHIFQCYRTGHNCLFPVLLFNYHISDHQPDRYHNSSQKYRYKSCRVLFKKQKRNTKQFKQYCIGKPQYPDCMVIFLHIAVSIVYLHLSFGSNDCGLISLLSCAFCPTYFIDLAHPYSSNILSRVITSEMCSV